jgi:hypothetical protein
MNRRSKKERTAEKHALRTQREAQENRTRASRRRNQRKQKAQDRKGKEKAPPLYVSKAALRRELAVKEGQQLHDAVEEYSKRDVAEVQEIHEDAIRPRTTRQEAQEADAWLREHGLGKK